MWEKNFYNRKYFAEAKMLDTRYDYYFGVQERIRVGAE